MKYAWILIAVAIETYAWTTNGGGNKTAFEKADVIYREANMEFASAGDYHSGMIGKFYVSPEGKPSLGIAHLSDNEGKDEDKTFNGIPVHLNALKARETSFWRAFGNGSWGPYDLRLREWEFTLSETWLHRKSTIDALGIAVSNLWGDEWGSAGKHYVGAFESRSSIESGLLTSGKRDEILQEAYGNIPYWSAHDDWGYEFFDMVNYNGEWEWWGIVPVYYSYFRGLYDIDDVRCEFLPEWSYEKMGVPVWGDANNSLKWLSGGSTDNGDYHNDYVDNNDGYTYDEVGPIVQSGDLYGNSRDSRNKTTMRPSTPQPPTIEYFWQSPTGPKFRIKENASTFVYYSIELTGAGGTTRYAKDADGVEYKYRKLYLSQDNGTYRSQTFYPSKYPADNWADYSVRLVVTDEGANTSELNFQTANNELPQTLNIYTLVPSSGLAPTQYRAGTTLNVYCSYANSGYPCKFNATLSENLFYMNGVPASPLRRATDQIGEFIEIAIPKGATSGPVRFVTNGARSNELNFTILPSIESIYPTTAYPGQSITLYGHDFPSTINGFTFFTEANAGNLTTNWIQTTNFTRVSSSELRVTVPANAFRGIQMLSTPTTNQHYAPLMDFLVQPKILSYDLISLRRKKLVITGENFSLTPEVWIGGEMAHVISATKTSIVAEVPPYIPFGTHQISVRNKHSHCKYFSWPDDNSYCTSIPQMESNSIPVPIKIIPDLQAVLMLLLQ